MERPNILTDGAAAQAYIEACRLLKLEPLGNITTYDYFAYWHEQAMNLMTPNNGVQNPRGRNAAHGGPSFGPWHRLMLLVFEAQCRRVLENDGFRVPFWDWGEDADDTGNSPIWDPGIMGGFGNPVRDGPFTLGRGWTVNIVDGPVFAPQPRGLRRSPNTFEQLEDNASIRSRIRNEPTYARFTWDSRVSSFVNSLEGPLHNTVHRWVGGDMRTAMSPNDPVFFLHHANIDRIWFAWQKRWGHDRYAPGDNVGRGEELNIHRLNDTLHAHFGIDFTPADLLSPHELPDPLRYDYNIDGLD